MKKYQCHKIVKAMKISAIEITVNGSVTLTGEDGYEILVSASWLEKHEPKIGGYYVRYEDGYSSWSPAGAFESGYTEI